VCEHNSAKRLYSHFGNDDGVREEGNAPLAQPSITAKRFYKPLALEASYDLRSQQRPNPLR
jgi:hypothetical protein